MSHGPARGGADDGTTQNAGDRAAGDLGPAGTRQWLRRMRLERKLHDGASLRISALSLRLGLLRGDTGADGDAAFQQAISELQDELHTVLDELRAVADHIYPPLLDQAGLGPALRELAVHAGHEVSVRAPDERFGTAVEGAAYFAVADCLAAWTDRADPVDVDVRLEDRNREDRNPDDRYPDDRYLVVTLKGVPACHADVMADHAEAMGGTVETAATEGAPGGGTITVRIPCA